MSRKTFDSQIPTAMRGGQFATTRWSVVLAAGKGKDSKGKKALATLCETYWYPIYVYLRRQADAQTASDLTQEFLTRLLERRDFEKADPQRGKFRSYLLAALKHFLADQRDHDRAQKRGGGQNITSLSLADSETRYKREPADERTPEKAFERRWALTVLENALAKLEDEFAQAGKKELFDGLKPHLAGNTEATGYAALAGKLGLTEGTFKVALHRLRRRYRDCLRAEVAETLASEDGRPPAKSEIEDEIRCLFAALQT